MRSAGDKPSLSPVDRFVERGVLEDRRRLKLERKEGVTSDRSCVHIESHRRGEARRVAYIIGCASTFVCTGIILCQPLAYTSTAVRCIHKTIYGVDQ